MSVLELVKILPLLWDTFIWINDSAHKERQVVVDVIDVKYERSVDSEWLIASCSPKD